MRAGWFAAGLVLFALAVAAKATPGPAPDFRVTPSPGEYAIANDALGALLETNYFHGPSRHVSSGATCRMLFDPFDKQRLASICR